MLYVLLHVIVTQQTDLLACNYMFFKVSYRNARARCEISSKLTIKTGE